MGNSSKTQKPSKPHPDYPLTANSNGQWSKKIKGKVFYFGKWEDHQAALARYNEHLPFILSTGAKKPEGATAGKDIRDLCNEFLSHKTTQLESGEITQRSFSDYHEVCSIVVEHFGKTRVLDTLTPSDFRAFRELLARKKDGSPRGLVTLKNYVGRIRVVFNFGFDELLFQNSPAKVIGKAFRMPSKNALRGERRSKPKKFFEAAQIRTLLNHEKCKPQLRAMILLGINGGFGNEDCATLPISSIDFDEGWIDHPRPKTHIERRTPLWAETIEALEVVLKERKEPKNVAHADLLFITKYGGSWSGTGNSSPVGAEFRKIVRAAKEHTTGRGFYSLRHSFETIGGGAKDQVSVNALMGHVDQTMAGVYREDIEDQRLVDVVNHVRDWLFDDSALVTTETQLRIVG